MKLLYEHPEAIIGKGVYVGEFYGGKISAKECAPLINHGWIISVRD
jgi:hypothetical protein